MFCCHTGVLGPHTHVGAAELLERLICEGSKEDQPLPTPHQLIDQLKALEPILLRSGFVREVLDWNFCLPESELSSQVKFNLPLVTPGQDQIKALVDALRYCSYIGEKGVTYIESSTNFIPWAIAFVKWFLGRPPTARRSKGSMIFGADFVNVSVEQTLDACRFTVSIHHGFDH